jgi:hypothetical protein
MMDDVEIKTLGSEALEQNPVFNAWKESEDKGRDVHLDALHLLKKYSDLERLIEDMKTQGILVEAWPHRI